MVGSCENEKIGISAISSGYCRMNEMDNERGKGKEMEDEGG